MRRAENGLTKSEITRASQWLKARDRDDILVTLIESGDIKPVMRGHRRTTQAMVYRLARWSGTMARFFKSPEQRLEAL